MWECMAAVTPAWSRFSRALKISWCSLRAAAAWPSSVECAVNPDPQQRPDALQEFGEDLVPGTFSDFAMERGVGFHEGCEVIEVGFHRGQVSAQASQGFIRDADRSQLDGLDFEASAEFDELAGPRLPEHQAPAQGAGQQLRDAVPEVGARAGPDHNNAEDLQGRQGFADG